MLTRLEIENYRCFPSLDVELRPLTVLIGPNNTGKSAFLDAILTLARRIPVGPADHWRLDQTASIKIRGTTSDSENPIEFDSQSDSNPLSERRDETRNRLLDSIGYYRLPSSGIVSLSDGIDESDTELELDLGEQGERLASVLDYMLRRDRKRFDAVVDSLRSLSSGFEDLWIGTPDPQTRHLGAVLNGGLRLPGESLSVGLRHITFFVTLANLPHAPNIILLEEPEHGVHPKRLGDIVRLLRGISQGELCDHPAQVILTTHSPFLLDHIDLDSDQLLIFQREEGPDGARNAYPADRERLRIFQDEFKLGEVWFNEDEKGLIGSAAR